jgi:hypothetical protein
VAGLVGALDVVFAVFAAKTKPKSNKNATATQVKNETIVVVCATTVPDT